MSRANVHELRDWAQGEFGGEGWNFTVSPGTFSNFLHGVNPSAGFRIGVMLIDWVVSWVVFDTSDAGWDSAGTVIGEGRIDLEAVTA